MAKNRIFWLMALMVSGMITGSILAKYESAFAAVPMLVTFIPMLTDTGGNAGSQSSTMVIRAMATGEVHFRDLFVVLWKEIRVGVLAGAVLSAVNFLASVADHSPFGRDCPDRFAGDVFDGCDGKDHRFSAPVGGRFGQMRPCHYGSTADYHHRGCICTDYVF